MQKKTAQKAVFLNSVFRRLESVCCCIACFCNSFCARSNFCGGSLYGIFSHIIRAFFNHCKLMFLKSVHSNSCRLLSELNVTLFGLIVNEAGFVSHHDNSAENRTLTFFTSIDIIKINSLRFSH